jgi:hypothetical protein
LQTLAKQKEGDMKHKHKWKYMGRPLVYWCRICGCIKKQGGYNESRTEYYYPKVKHEPDPKKDITKCPGCGGPSGGNDREVPPNPYYCDDCYDMGDI